MEPTSFEHLLDRARRGEGDALAELWTRHARAVGSYARARGAEDPDAVTSDAFLGCFSQLATFTGDEDGFRALLFTIARRRVADDARRRSRRVRVTDLDETHDRRTASSAEETVVARESGSDLLALVDQLSPGQREVILLRLVADLSIESVAATLGKSPGTVKSLQRRGLDALRRAMATQTAGPTDDDQLGEVSR